MVSNRYRKRPSEMLGIEDEYVAYCLDEACAYIMNRLDEKEEMYFEKHYSSFSELYSNYK